MKLETPTKAQIQKENRRAECRDIYAAIATQHPEVTKYSMAKALGVRWDRINSWDKGTKVPNESGLEALRRFFKKLTQKGKKYDTKRAAAAKRKTKKA